MPSMSSLCTVCVCVCSLVCRPVPQVTFQYAIWDKLKMLASLPKHSVNNLWRLVSHLVAHKALSLGILRVGCVCVCVCVCVCALALQRIEDCISTDVCMCHFPLADC